MFEIFHHKKKEILPIPEGFTADDLKIESSTCTGEKTIGFYNKADKKLYYSELVMDNDDIRSYCAKYGIEAKERES